MLKKIKSLCKANNIMIKDLEQQAGLAYNTLNRWDKISPSIDKVAAVADVLCVSIDELVGRSSPILSPEDRQLLDLVHQLNEEGQGAALAMLQGLAQQPGYIKSGQSGEMEA